MKCRVLSLLREVKEACEKENLDFFVSGDLALRLYRKESLENSFNDVSIMIFAKDVDRISDVLRKNANRTVESLVTNKRFPGYYLRYMDAETTLFNCSDNTFNYNTNAIGIDIVIICHCINKGFKDRVLNLLKKSWTRCFKADYLIGRQRKKTRIKLSLMKCFFRLIGTSAMMNSLFKAWTLKGCTKGQTAEVALNNGTLVTFNSNMFEAKTYLWIGDEKYPFVKDLEQFFTNYYQTGVKVKPKKNEIFSETVAWDQYKRLLDRNRIALKPLQRRQQRYNKWKREVYEPRRKKRTYYYNWLFCTEDRMKYYKLYPAEKREYLLNLYSNHQYELVKKEMEEYLQKIERYAKIGIGFCFDYRLFEIAMHLLILEASVKEKTVTAYDAQCKKILQIVRNVPYQHFDSIKNIFWGQRESDNVLMEEKEKVYNRVIQLCDEYRIEV